MNTNVDEAPSAEALDAFSVLLTIIRTVSPDAYLVSNVRLWGGGANAHAALGPWAGHAQNRDKLRQILAMQNRAPFETEFGVLEGAGLEEYAFQGDRCVGLGYAHRLDLLSVSIPARAAFDLPWLNIERSSLSPDAQDLHTERVAVRHAQAPGHVDMHREWMVLGQGSSATGAELWANRRALFDRVDFLDRVEADFAALEGKSLKAVHEKLASLQAAVAEWQPGAFLEPRWRTKVTPESASRIAAGRCAFRESGAMVNFSQHARFTPGAGRIHFRLDASSARLVVAYVGAKRL